MFCPNCATPTQIPDQNFCKTCGTNLLAVTQALSVSGSSPVLPAFPPQTGAFVNASPPPAFSPQLEAIPHYQDQLLRRKLSRIGWGMMGGGILLAMFLSILGGAFEALSGRLGHFIGELASFGGFFFMSGIILLIYNRILHKKHPLPQVVVLQPNGTAVPVTPGLQPPPISYQNLPPAPATIYDTPPSVTENTTAHLKIPFQAPFPQGSRDTQ